MHVGRTDLAFAVCDSRVAAGTGLDQARALRLGQTQLVRVVRRSEVEIVLALCTHPVGVGTSSVPCDVYPAYNHRKEHAVLAIGSKKVASTFNEGPENPAS